MKSIRFSRKEFALLNLGAILIAVGVYFFKFPNHFSTGGVSGISVVLSGLLSKTSPGVLVFSINLLLLGVGYLFFGRGFGVKTAYASLMFSAVTWLLEWIYPISAPLTDEPLLELIFAVMLPAIGSAILFDLNASSGGTDVIAMILRKYTALNIGRALLLSDLIISLATFPVFGVKVGLFSLLGLGSKALLVDSVIESFNLCKYFTIITSKPDEICNFIVGTLHRGATVEDARGAFTHQPKTVILTVVRRPQGVHLQRFIREVDPNAFMFITNTSEIIGKGFRGVS